MANGISIVISIDFNHVIRLLSILNHSYYAKGRRHIGYVVEGLLSWRDWACSCVGTSLSCKAEPGIVRNDRHHSETNTSYSC